VVEKIVAVQSVDLVADPATTKGLFEASEREVEAVAVEMKEVAPLPVSERAADVELLKLQQHLCESEHTIAQLQQQVAAAEKTVTTLQRQARLRVLLCEAGLWHALVPGDRPAGAVDQVLWEQLLAAEQESTQRQLIGERKRLLESWQHDARYSDGLAAESGTSARGTNARKMRERRGGHAGIFASD
jgi:hypothetical protein